MPNITFVKIMSELGAGTRGASLGYDALVTASHNVSNPLLNRFPTVTVETKNEALYEATATPYARYIHSIEEVFQNIRQSVSGVLNSNKFPVVLAGDHSTAAATIQAIKKAEPHKRLGIVWIDAHGDLHSPYTTPSGNVHGMPLAIALKEDNQENAINSLDDKTLNAWESICGEPAINSEDIVFFGVRDTEIPEDELILAKGIKNISVEEVRMKGAKQTCMDALEHLNACDHIYISFDVDSMDSSISNGTGTPVINGFSAVEAHKIISYILNSGKVCCFEMVEVNPTLDQKGNVMAETAFDVLNETIKILEKQ